jgi:hypothetical protein
MILLGRHERLRSSGRCRYNHTDPVITATVPGAAEELIWSATWVPGLPGRSTMATRPPAAANPAAMADPSPPAAPVMMTVVPVNRIPSLLALCRPTMVTIW